MFAGDFKLASDLHSILVSLTHLATPSSPYLVLRSSIFWTQKCGIYFKIMSFPGCRYGSHSSCQLRLVLVALQCSQACAFPYARFVKKAIRNEHHGLTNLTRLSRQPGCYLHQTKERILIGQWDLIFAGNGVFSTLTGASVGGLSAVSMDYNSTTPQPQQSGPGPTHVNFSGPRGETNRLTSRTEITDWHQRSWKGPILLSPGNLRGPIMDRPPHLWSLAIWNSEHHVSHTEFAARFWFYGCMGCLNASAL